MTFTLLSKKTYEFMPAYIENFVRVRAARPSMLGPFVKGFEEVAAFDVTSPGFPFVVQTRPAQATLRPGRVLH